MLSVWEGMMGGPVGTGYGEGYGERDNRGCYFHADRNR